MDIKVNSCCFCVELRKGILILAYIGLIQNIILPILVLSNFEMVCRSLDIHLPSDPTTVKSILFGMLAVLFITLIFHVIFVIAVHKDHPIYIKYCLIFSLAATIVTAIGYIVRLAIAASFLAVFKMFLTLGLEVYFLVAIRSYYWQIKDRPNEPDITNKP